MERLKQCVDQIDVRNKRVFLRADFNVPLDGDMHIADDRRIRSSAWRPGWLRSSPRSCWPLRRPLFSSGSFSDFRRELSIAFFAGVFGLGQFVGPSMGGAISDRSGNLFSGLTFSVLVLAGGAFGSFFRKKRPIQLRRLNGR